MLILTTSGILSCMSALDTRESYAATRGHIDVFIEESGKPGSNNKWFAVGALGVANVARHIARLAAIRKSAKYKINLSHDSSNKFKKGYAEALMDYLFEDPDIWFDIVLFDNSRWPKEKETRSTLYFGMYRSLLSDGLVKANSITLHKATHNTVGLEDRLHKYIGAEVPLVTEVKKSEKLADDLIQFADFLTGCAASRSSNLTCKVKTDLIASLESRIAGVATAKAKFRQTIVSPPV